MREIHLYTDVVSDKAVFARVLSVFKHDDESSFASLEPGPDIDLSDGADEGAIMLMDGATPRWKGDSGRTPGAMGGYGRGGGGSSGPGADPRGLTSYIRRQAALHGVDPDVAVRVARSEGLKTFLGDRGKSGGAFQLYTGGGLGNQFQRETGLDPLDPKNERATIAWAMKYVGETKDWSPWHGARRVGISSHQGFDYRGTVPEEDRGGSQKGLLRSGATDGATPRSGDAGGMRPEFRSRLDEMFAAARAEGTSLSIKSGYRSQAHQDELFAASDRSGHMVARHSMHTRGLAADLGGDLAWAHEHAHEYGLHFPMSWENWHIEPIGARDIAKKE